MLKNEDLKQISKANTLLTIIYQYTLEIDNNDLYEKTGVTLKDIHDSIKALTHIHTIETLKHIKASEKANKWNKANPEKHRKHSRDYERRKRGWDNMEEIKNIHNCKYDLNGNLYFTANDNRRYKISTKDALEIAYTLFDSVGHSYDELDEISDELI